MRRRGLLAAAAALLASALATALAESGSRSITFSLARVQASVAERFPRRYGVQGLLDLIVRVPRLALLPERNRLAAAVPLQASGPLIGRAYDGEADVDFGLRYEASDRTLRATEPRIDALRLDGLPAQTARMLRESLDEALRQTLREVVVQRLGERDLALADTLGLAPGAISVTPEGLRVELVAKTP